jgi:hypothetical protein
MSKCQTVQDEKKIESIAVKTRSGTTVPKQKIVADQRVAVQPEVKS